MQDAPIPDPGIIPLKDKSKPTETVSPSIYESLHYATTYGDADVTELKHKILSLPSELWTEAYNCKYNVSFKRPFHDKLGVNKIIFVFSDNKLNQVFYLPLWDSWKSLLLPIIEAMSFDPSKIVRCLLARLPAQTLIPPHHDNGTWVSKTHRMHVPIITNSKVEFKSGPVVDKMCRYAFNEGCIVELNNAAKHSVYNGSDEDRVHLILDYVEGTPTFQTIHLQAGQICRQIRGRVELVHEGDEDVDEQRKGEEIEKLSTQLRLCLVHAHGNTIAEEFWTSLRHYFIQQINAREFWSQVKAYLLPSQHNEGVSFSQRVEETVYHQLETLLELVDPLMLTEIREAQALNMQNNLQEECQNLDSNEISTAFHHQCILENKKLEEWQIPSFVIIGSQKCGTTALYDYVVQHPQAAKGERRETHFFDWNWGAVNNHLLSDEERNTASKVVMEFTQEKQDEKIQELRMKYLLCLRYPLEKMERPLILGESTPSYLLYGKKVAERMKELYPKMRLIVMLRDPVARAYSHYQMAKQKSCTKDHPEAGRLAIEKKSFQDVVDEDLQLLKNAKVTPDEGSCDNFQNYCDQLPLNHGNHSFLGRGIYVHQLAIWFNIFPRDQFYILPLESLKDSEECKLHVNKVFEFIGLPPYTIGDTSPKNSRKYDKIDPLLEKKLQKFYEPYNKLLEQLLDRTFQWTTTSF